jgi:hypothetical protein
MIWGVFEENFLVVEGIYVLPIVNGKNNKIQRKITYGSKKE